MPICDNDDDDGGGVLDRNGREHMDRSLLSIEKLNNAMQFSFSQILLHVGR